MATIAGRAVTILERESIGKKIAAMLMKDVDYLFVNPEDASECFIGKYTGRNRSALRPGRDFNAVVLEYEFDIRMSKCNTVFCGSPKFLQWASLADWDITVA